MRPRSLRVFDLHPGASDLEAEVLSGLAKTQKTLPCKYFYDSEGAQLFEAICATKEYYITRTERQILKQNLPELAKLIGPRAIVIEPGSGSGAKTRTLLGALDTPAAYVPVDISRAQLLVTAAEIAGVLPDLEVLPVCADFTQSFPLPSTMAPAGRRVLFYPGSTIGNLDRREGEAFLRRMSEIVGKGGALLVGFDLKKDPNILHAAYNDSNGITARFNKNLLVRIKSTLDADVDVDGFEHYAFYNPIEGRIEMHLVSLKNQSIRVGGSKFLFNIGESIWTECSYKYTRAEIRGMAGRAGLRLSTELVDDRGWFSLALLSVPE